MTVEDGTVPIIGSDTERLENGEGRRSESEEENMINKENISVEELFTFNMRAEFETLRDGAPMLYHVICGAMGVEKKDLKVICNEKNISYLLFL